MLHNNKFMAVPFKISFRSLLKFYPVVLFTSVCHILLRAICFVPLVFFRFKALILSFVFYLGLSSYLRQSFAFAIYECCKGGSFSFIKSFVHKNFLSCIKDSLIQLLSILLWGIPLFILTTVFYYYYTGGTDFKSLALFIRNIGISLYGANAGIVEGSKIIILVYIFALFILCIGISRQCGVRYLNASLSNSLEIKKCLSHKRMKQFLIFLLNIVVLSPIVYIILSSIINVYSNSDSLLTFIPTIIRFKFYFPIISFVIVWFILSLPIRRFINASFSSDCKYIYKNESNQNR